MPGLVLSESPLLLSRALHIRLPADQRQGSAHRETGPRSCRFLPSAPSRKIGRHGSVTQEQRCTPCPWPWPCGFRTLTARRPQRRQPAPAARTPSHLTLRNNLLHALPSHTPPLYPQFFFEDFFKKEL